MYSSKLYDSISCNFSNAGEFSLGCILGVHVKKKKLTMDCSLHPSQKCHIGEFHLVVKQLQAVTVKQCDACRVILLIAFLNLLPLPLWSLKFPDTHSIQLTGTVPKVLYSNKFDRGFNRKTK